MAIDQTSSGDTLIFKAGTYSSPGIEIRKPLTLIGEPGALLDGEAKNYILKILADSVTVQGFALINSGRSYTKDYAAIYIHRSIAFALINNTVKDSFFGFLIEKSSNGRVHGNKIIGTATREDQSGNGVHLWDCDSILISENEVSGMRDGIYLEFVDGSEIIENYSHHNVRYGLHFMFSNHDRYTRNTFERNGAGVAVMFSKWIHMEHNRFTDNWGTASYGLLLKEIYDAEVLNNTFLQNTLGVFVDGSSRVNYSGNTFRQNGWAIKVSGGCYTNVFKGNNFLGNSFDVSYNSKMNDNSFNGNFWGSYSGYDLDKDGTGDVPYRPVKLFSYVVNKTPETIVLLRSLFVDIINFSEKVSPAFTPDDLVDLSPSMRLFQ
tara:strand:- start:13087 stop:14217 length:1131 start_codon:yes stop_codon:yes gene_type:complete